VSTFKAGLFSNVWLWLAVGSIAVAQFAIVRVDWLSDFFDASSLGGGQFLLCAVAGSLVLWFEELRKLTTQQLARR
jgi:magnesium-transporting ATPase (P-type)